MQVWAVLDNFTGPNGVQQAFLASDETRTAVIEKVIDNAVSMGIDGINVDIEIVYVEQANYAEIVNTRLTENRKTVISTNLTDAELAARYLPQIVSRLNGEYETLVFLGEDIRAIRKEQRYQ